MFNDIKFQKMEGQNKRFVRFQNHMGDDTTLPGKYAFDTDTESLTRTQGSLSSSVKRGWERGSKGLIRFGRSLRFGAARVYSEECEPKEKKIWDPMDKFVQRWNRVFVLSCLVAVYVDPFFLYLPVVDTQVCVEIDDHLAIVATILRTITDIFYLFHMALQFRTGFIAPSSRVLGKGELVTDSVLIAKRYLSRDFLLDLTAVLPLPQVFIWVVIPAMKGTTAVNLKNALRFIVFFQYLPRIYRIVPLTHQMVRTTGIFTETAWAGAAYNLLLYMLASHVLGAFWYLLAVERNDTCWRKACRMERPSCSLEFLDCGSLDSRQYPNRTNWLNSSNIIANCSAGAGNTFFNFGIYGDALNNNIVTSRKFIEKYFYCLWWGLRNLSTLGQGLATSTYVGEVMFSIALAILGLVLFARLIGNMQTYLQSLTVRLEEMRLKRRDTEQWMRHRQLPTELRERVRRYDQYKWLETRGVEEEALVKTLPKDLHRDIKSHLCMELVRKVPLFASMDERLLDAICERLQPTLFTHGTYIVREGDPVDEMLFIIRGHLKSVTTNGGRTGFLNEGKLKPGDFCGDELLTWALDPKSGENLPSSTRSVSATTEVEAFALRAEDLKFVAGQFRRLHSKQVRHTFRHYSHQWQTWAACSIQAAWRRYQRRKLAEERRKEEDDHLRTAMLENNGLVNTSLGATLYASRFAVNAMRGVHRLRSLQAEKRILALKLQKPAEPDFLAEEGD